MSKKFETVLNDFLKSSEAKDLSGSLIGMLKDVVNDVTDPNLHRLFTELAVDAIKVQAMKANGADAQLIEEAEGDLRARGQSLLKVPGLVASGRQALFMDWLSRALNVVGAAASAALTGWVGQLVPAIAGAAESAIGGKGDGKNTDK